MITHDFPAAHGKAVTERHVKTCASQGHTKWVANGEDMDRCARCGEITVTVTERAEIMSNQNQIRLAVHRAAVLAAKDWHRIRQQMRDSELEALGIEPGDVVESESIAQFTSQAAIIFQRELAMSLNVLLGQESLEPFDAGAWEEAMNETIEWLSQRENYANVVGAFNA